MNGLGPPVIYDIRGHTIWIHFAFKNKDDNTRYRFGRVFGTIPPTVTENRPAWNDLTTRFLMLDDTALLNAYNTIGPTNSINYGDWF